MIKVSGILTQDQSDHDQGGQLKGDQGNQVDQREPDQAVGCSAPELPLLLLRLSR